MTVTEKLMGLGQFSLNLREDTSRDIMRRLDVTVTGTSTDIQTGGFAAIVITPTRHVGALSDSILTTARYTGILRKQEGDFGIGGCGTAMYLGDENGVGTFFTTAVSVGSPGNFTSWVSALIPGSGLTAGTVSTGLTGHVFSYDDMSLKDVLADVMSRFNTEWRVNPDFTVDLGRRADLFEMTPRVVISRNVGRELGVFGVTGELGIDRDVEDLVRQVHYYSGSGPTLTSETGGVADADFPYRAPDGGGLRRNKKVTAGTIAAGSESDFAEAEFEKVRYPHEEFTVTSDDYSITGVIKVGDNVWLDDPARGIQDTTQVVPGRPDLKPQVIRCVGLTWAVRRGMGVYLRRWVKTANVWSLEWTDLSDYIEFEDSRTAVEVGAKPRPIAS